MNIQLYFVVSENIESVPNPLIHRMAQTGIELPFITSRNVRAIFICADVASFLIQCAGGGLSASKNIEVSINGKEH
jgi:hypothetical protein